MNIDDRIEALRNWPRVPRAIVTENDPDFLAWRGVLPNSVTRWGQNSELLKSFLLWLHITDAGLRDYWRFMRYQGRNNFLPARHGKYPLNVAGFVRFLEKEPGRWIPSVAGAVAGFAVGGPVGAVAGYGAARGAQDAHAAGTNIVAGAAGGALSGYGVVMQGVAPVLGIALPGSSGTASKVGAGLQRLGRRPPTTPVEEKVDSYPEQYRKLLNALISVESGGDPNAVSPSGTYVGLLQMGPDAARDVGIDNYKGELLGNASAAIDAFWAYQARYKSRTGGHPFLMALLWKGGPGTVSKFRRLMGAGASAGQALAQSAPASWNVEEYIRRTARAYAEA